MSDANHVDAIDRMNEKISWHREPNPGAVGAGAFDRGEADFGEFILRVTGGNGVCQFAAKGNEYNATLNLGAVPSLTDARNVVPEALLAWLATNRPNDPVRSEFTGSATQTLSTTTTATGHNQSQ